MYIYLSIYIYIHMYVYTYIYIHMYIPTYIDIQVHTSLHYCIIYHVCMCIYIYEYIYIYIYTYYLHTSCKFVGNYVQTLTACYRSLRVVTIHRGQRYPLDTVKSRRTKISIQLEIPFPPLDPCVFSREIAFFLLEGHVFFWLGHVG